MEGEPAANDQTAVPKMANVSTPTHEILFIACPFQKEPYSSTHKKHETQQSNEIPLRFKYFFERRAGSSKLEV
jgi:hypothetical protein